MLIRSTISSTVPDYLAFADSGPPSAVEGYGHITFRLNAVNNDRWLPWIVVTTMPFVLPLPKALEGKYEVQVVPKTGVDLRVSRSPISSLRNIDVPVVTNP